MTAFTIGHATSLCLAYLGVVAIPSRWVEPVISLSIVAAALMALRGRGDGIRPWIAVEAGLVHGLGLASSLESRGLATPYQLSFRVDQSALAGLAPADVQVWRNGVALGGCTDPDAAVPDPCIAFRGFTPEAGDGGDALVTVRTSRFSTWTLGAVDYNLVGPYAPVDALPVVNTTKAGSAVPVKFRVGGDRGLDIFSAGYPKVVATTSCTGGTDEVEQTVNVGTSALTYDAASGTYTYRWKTAKTDTGCKELVLRMKDGSALRARFNLR